MIVDDGTVQEARADPSWKQRHITRVFPVPFASLTPLKHGAYFAPRRKHLNVIWNGRDRTGLGRTSYPRTRPPRAFLVREVGGLRGPRRE